ncbi:MAG: carboxypeptidase regulatory-like domain-containing protein [Armatimonadota bacterium]
MQKGRILLTLVVMLCAAIIVANCVASLSAPAMPARSYPAALSAAAYSSAGLLTPSGRRYIGTARPDWLFDQMQMRAQQGSGPIPDVQLTPTATASEEYYADSASYGELNRIVIASNGVDADGDGRLDPGVTADDFNLWLLRVDGSLATRLTSMVGDELYPAYDPGGRLIAFSSNATGTWQIYTVELLTGTIRQITYSAGNKYEPTWSPDGKSIVYSGQVGNQRDLFIVPSDGSQLPRPIIQTPETESQPAWAPTPAVGTAPILFTRSGTGTGSRIWRIGSNGQDEEQVTNGGGNPSANDADPAWRHNGQLIAFASDRLVDGTDAVADYNIYTVSPAGEDTFAGQLRTNLDVSDTRDDRYPTFNPGLNPREPVRIFFTSWRDDGQGAEPDIWRFEVGDPVPPELVELPSVDAPRRLAAAGSEVTVFAEVFDRDSGVSRVVAEFKDPDSPDDDSRRQDHKIFQFFGDGEESVPMQTCSFQIIAREVDCETVGQAELFDDGDSAHGDEVAGDGIFSGKWTTPMSPSDFIIDIHVEDNAGNDFEYDDVYGFTTQPFQPVTNCLLVDDYCEGQAFIYNASGENNDLPTAFPVESYYTENPGGAGSHNTIRDGRYGEPYDLWRVICRGPITMTELLYYLPTRETQLTVPDLSGTREVLVADRAVIWAAPHSGDVWAAPGSIVDATTQATLSTYLDRGGRLMISGQNIGFALTLDGTSPNSFYTNYLHAQYVRDDLTRATDGFIDGVDSDPVIAHPFNIWSSTYPPPEDSCAIGWWLTNNVYWAQDCAHFTVWPDVIEAVGGGIVTHQYDTEETAGVRYEAPGGGYRVAYYAWGFEQTHKYYETLGQACGCSDYRHKMMHNTLCWLRTGGFQGRVLSISDGNQPINNPTPIVRLFQGSTMVAAVECEEDGRYVIGGVPPGIYTLSAYRPGYEIDHYDAASTHGGLAYPVVDFAITRAAPGAIRGTVTSEATGEPLAAVQVCAYEAVTPEREERSEPAQAGEEFERGQLFGCTKTAADGTYIIGNLPPGNVIVVADGSAIGYATDEEVAQITSGNTSTLDFALSAAPGVLVATVTDADGNPLENATVQLLSGTQVVAEGMTDQDGQVSIEAQPGGYTVVAAAPGYQRSDAQAITLEAAETVEITIALQSEPPGSITGLISRALSGEAVGGVRVELVVGQSIIATTTTSATVTTPPTGQRYNYRFDGVPTGQITVRPDPVGFSVSPATRVVTVVSGQVTGGVNFAVSSIRTFPVGLQLISLPYDYPNTDPAALLGANPATFKMAAWEPSVGRYLLYPSTPADRFRLGTGYWLLLSQVLELSTEGVEAEDVFELPLEAGTGGWNLIGDFFTEPLDIYSVQVRDRNGVVRSMQQALSAGLVRSPLFAYVLGAYTTSAVAEPYVGYWLNVGQDVTLIGDRRTDTLAAGAEATRPAVSAPEGGWLIPLVVSSGTAADKATWIGCAPAATDGFDAGLDMLKPPAPGLASCVYAAAGEDRAFAVDLRPEAAGTTWPLSVVGPVGETVRVTWPDLCAVPAEMRPVLVDPSTGAEVYMRTSHSYEFTAREGARELRVRLLGEEGLLTVSAPAARQAGAGVEISYTLSADAEVEVAVLNIAGRLVDRVVSGAVHSAGAQRVSWDGLSAQGTRAPGGVYLVLVRARAENGQQAQAVGTVRLAR